MRHWSLYLCAVVAGAAWFYAATSPKPIPPMEYPSSGSFDPALISHGEALAAVGNCDGCHTAKGGARLAGGRGIPTPFGMVYSTNITPDETPDWDCGRRKRFNAQCEMAFLVTAISYIRRSRMIISRKLRLRTTRRCTRILCPGPQ